MSKRRFPSNTCPASRHVEMLADQLMDDRRSVMIESEPENCACSMCSTVESLYGARDRIEQLERVLLLAREAMHSCIPADYSTGHVIHASFDNDAVDAAIAAIDEALKS